MSERQPYRPYSRHYHDLIDDEKFETVYPDDHHYACWSRLLMIADQAWPASAHLPVTARRASVRHLAEVGLIDLLPDGRFRMHGTQAERERRSKQAKGAAEARWSNADSNAPSNADSNATASAGDMPRRDETRKDETSQDEDPAWLRAWLAVKARMPSPAQQTVIENYCRVFDATGPQRAARIFLANPDDMIGALKTDLATFRSERKAEAEREEREAQERRKPRGIRDPETQEFARILAERMAEKGRPAA